MMKCNLSGLLTNGAKRDYLFPLEELCRNLRELRDRTRAGDMTVLDEFFRLYVFGDAKDDELPRPSRVAELEAAIRQHRDERGDDRCHADDGRLYAVLPEGDTRPERETAVTIENCQRYIECRQTGREYVSPQRRIEELEAEVVQLRQRLSAVEGLESDWRNLCSDGDKIAGDMRRAIEKIESETRKG
jgi:hypothetical protein